MLTWHSVGILKYKLIYIGTGEMEITWLGHSCLRLISDRVTLLTDPYSESLGLSMGNQKTDIATISHTHPYHSHHEGLDGNPWIIDGPGEYEIACFYIKGTGTSHGDNEGNREINTVYCLQAEGLNLCHLGDLTRPLSPRQVEQLGRPDVLFVPAGGICTIDTAQAAELVNLMDPRIVIPIHYKLDGLKIELGPIEAFLADMGITEVTRQDKINVTPSNLPRDLRVVVLDHVS